MQKAYTKFLWALLPALFIQASGNAQSGPGGIGKTDGTSNLKIWLRADTGVFINAGTTAATNEQNVQQWNDQSGNNLHAIQTTALNKPVFTAAAVNGLPALGFSDDLLDIPYDISPAVNPDITVLAVVTHRTAAATPGSRFFGHDNGGYDRTVGFDDRGGTTFAYTYFNGLGVVGFANLAANQPFITTNGYTPAAFSGWINGTQLVTNAASNNGPGKNILTVGNITSTVGTPFYDAYWNGFISEFIMFNKILTAAERIIVENYLSAKYNTVLAANDLYIQDNSANGNFDFNVAGIGMAADGSSVTTASSSIVTISNPSALTSGEFLMWGHDNASLSANSNDVPAGFMNRIQRVWRASETGDAGSTTLSFNMAGYPVGSAADLSLLIDQNNNGIFSDETVAGGGVINGAAQSGSTYSFSNINIADGQRFTIGSAVNGTLPITLSGFAVTKQEAGNRLTWVSSNEQNGNYFDIEKSIDGIRFSKIGYVKASGNNTAGSSYSFTDNHPGTDENYYRLKMVDIGGRSAYSSIIRVEGPGSSLTVRLTPNPATDVLTISGLSGTSSRISLLDLNGRTINQYTTANSQYTININNQPEGTYTLRIKDDKGIYMKRFIKQ